MVPRNSVFFQKFQICEDYFALFFYLPDFRGYGFILIGERFFHNLQSLELSGGLYLIIRRRLVTIREILQQKKQLR